MRLEDKELEGPDLEREQGLEKLEDETHENDKELPEHAGTELIDAELAHRDRLFDALQLILAKEDVSIPMLYLPQREAQALEALQAAVTGRDRSMNTFVFAEDRKSLLEQALSVLQQNLTRGDQATLAALHAKYDEMTENVAALREELLGLEDAQDDLIEQKRPDKTVGEAPETEDADESVTGFIASALNALAQVALDHPQEFQSTLSGAERPEVAKGPSTLDGPEVEVVEKPTTLAGAELPDRAAHVSMLDAAGPEATKAAYVSALDGPELVVEEKQSSLQIDMDAVIVPAHLRPRVAENAPVGMRTDGRESSPYAEHVDDGRGPAPPTIADEQRPAEIEPEPATPTKRESQPAIAPTRQSEPASQSKNEDKPSGRRGLSVRSSEKPGKKK